MLQVYFLLNASCIKTDLRMLLCNVSDIVLGKFNLKSLQLTPCKVCVLQPILIYMVNIITRLRLKEAVDSNRSHLFGWRYS